MGLFSRLKKMIEKECVQEPPRVLLKDTTNTAKNHHPHLPDEAPVVSGGTDGGKEAEREEKKEKKSLRRWPGLSFPRLKDAKYDLVKAERKYQADSYQTFTDEPIVVKQPLNMPLAGDIDGERKKGKKEEKKKKKRSWRWPVLPFPRRRAAKYDPDEKAEKYHQTEAGTYRTFTDAPASKVHPPAEKQLEQDVPGKGHIRSRYKIGNKLGQGRFGFVYEGTRCQDGLEVAVKFSVKPPNMPHIRVPGHSEGVPMEIGLTLTANQSPSGPQIIKLLDWEDNEDHYIMVMERPMPCMDLKSFVKLHGERLDEGTARKVMRQAIEAANICIKHGVFHRDIKMENLLVNQDTMEVKLIDFGCGAQMKKFAYIVFRGTKAYCPPEVTVNGRYHAKPTTVWSLGILLFMMACGYYPTDYDLDLISKRSWTRPGLSQECCHMISACLQSDPQQRINLEKMHLHDWFKVME